MSSPSWPSLPCVHIRKLVSACKLQMSVAMTSCQVRCTFLEWYVCNFLAVLFCVAPDHKMLVVFAQVTLPPDRERWWLVGWATTLQRSIQSPFEALFIVIVVTFVVIVVMYVMRYQSACCILNNAPGQCCELGGRYKLRGFRPNCTIIDKYWYLQLAVNRAICEATI